MTRTRVWTHATEARKINTIWCHCNTLQHIWTQFNTLQHNCNTLSRTATHGNTRQHTATHGNTQQHTATHGKRHGRLTQFDTWKNAGNEREITNTPVSREGSCCQASLGLLIPSVEVRPWENISVCRLNMCDMPQSYVWHDSFICVTWSIHMCGDKDAIRYRVTKMHRLP